MLIIAFLGENGPCKDKAPVSPVDVGRTTVEARNKRSLEEVVSCDLKALQASRIPSESDLHIALAYIKSVRNRENGIMRDNIRDPLIKRSGTVIEAALKASELAVVAHALYPAVIIFRQERLIAVNACIHELIGSFPSSGTELHGCLRFRLFAASQTQ